MRQVLDMVGLWERKDNLVSTFSGGMQRRLEIARGLLHAPHVLFLDEPTVGLDPQTRSSIWTYINDLKRREDITIFLTTHYMDEAENCDRIAIIDHGRIVAIDTPEALKASVGKRPGPDPHRGRRRRDRGPRGVASGSRRRCTKAPSPSRSPPGRSSCRRLFRRAGCADPLGERLAPVARRRVHVLYGKHHPRCRGVEHRRDAPDGRTLARGEALAHGNRVRRPRRRVETEARLVAEIRVALPEHGLRHDLRAVSIVWRRELIRFRTDRLRAITSLVQPFLFLFVLGTGLSTLAKGGLPPGRGLQDIHLPGRARDVGACSPRCSRPARSSGTGSSGSYGRCSSPRCGRASLVIGKCLGGATIATFQGIVFLALAWFAHVPYNPVLLLTLVGELLLLSFTLTAFGLMMAARIKQFQSFMALTQMLVMPLFFLSGALYPLNGLPAWLSVLTRIDPLTYIVGPMRHSVFSHLSLPRVPCTDSHPNITWGELDRPGRCRPRHRRRNGFAMITIAIAEFRKTE